MDTIIYILPSLHVPTSWGMLEDSIRRWSGADASRLWGPTTNLSAWREAAHRSELPRDFILDATYRYRIDLAGDDHGPWINYHSQHLLTHPRNLFGEMGPTLLPSEIDHIIKGIQQTGYFFSVLTRPNRRLPIERLKIVACAMAELVHGRLGNFQDEFDALPDGIYSLEEFKHMQLPYRVPREVDE
jgi:hypothetical protein